MGKLNVSAMSVPPRLAVLVSSWLPTVTASTADVATRSMFPRLNRRYTELEVGWVLCLGIEGTMVQWYLVKKTPGIILFRFFLYMGEVRAGTRLRVAIFLKHTRNIAHIYEHHRVLHKTRFIHQV